MNKVKFEYLINNLTEFKTLHIDYNEYFDLDKDEEIDTDSVPKYLQPYEYLDIHLKEIVFLKVSFEINNNKRTIKQSFWNDGENIVTENIEKGDRNYHELIISVRLNESSEFFEVLKLNMDFEFIFPKYHGLFSYKNGKSEKEDKFDTDIFKEILDHIDKK
ncbi:MAG: hypothetical protein ACE364_04740 [Chlorobiota bacterium]